MSLTIEERITRGNRARELLTDETLSSALAEIEADAFSAWKIGSTVEARETAWQQLSAGALVTRKLESLAQDGEVAARERDRKVNRSSK